MARPLKDGIDYFPLDVGFLQDKKVRLIKGEYGLKGVLIILQILCSIYRENGYFATCDDDDCILVAEAVGCGCDANTIREVVQGCLRRSIFDSGVFEAFGVLTSRGIQRRYLRAVSTRDNIEIFQEYWLLDKNDKKDVPASILKKITFKNVNLQRNLSKIQNNAIDLQNNPKSKVKKSRVKESKVEGDFSDVFQMFEKCGFQITGYSAEEILTLIDRYSDKWVIEAIKRSADRGKKSLSYIKGILANWEAAGAIDDPKSKATGIDWSKV